MFDVGKWKTKIFSLLGMYDDLCLVLNDESSKKLFIEKHQVKQFLKAGDFEGLSDDIKELIVHGSLKSISEQFAFSLETGADYLSRQIVVTLPSYIEAMSEEFLELLFAKYPDRANRYLSFGDSNKKGLGFVELNLIAKAESLEQLRIEIAKDATSKAIRGAKPKLFERMEVASNGGFSESIKSDLLEIVRLRNKIVHDTHEPKLDSDSVRKYCLSVFEFVEELASLAGSNGIDTVDPSRIE